MRRRVEEVVARPGCEAVAASWSAVVSEDLDSLGDNSPSVIASHQVRVWCLVWGVLLSAAHAQDQDRPWSWRVYAYKKKQVCNSELYFMRPAFARDTTGQSKGFYFYIYSHL